jgi:PAS domain S-box-containing protein
VDDTAGSSAHRAAPPDASLAEVLGGLCTVVRERTGNDFSDYKRSTLGRRVQRRMAALGIDSPAVYLARAESDPTEAEALLHELLVSVTQFFRDPETLDVLPVEALAALPELRVWVCGCATGEEAYSLAMLLLERRAPAAEPAVVFATDVDEAALAVARAGRYGDAAVAGISPERLARFFVREPGGWVVGRELRDCCVFSRHNLVHDPPFSRLALVSCRNVLIYLEGPLQARLLPTFHFALRPDGVLLLGSAESADQRPDLFEAIDRRHRLYRRTAAVVAHVPSFPAAGADRPSQVTPTRPPTPQQGSPRVVERILLESYAPPAAVVTGAGEVVYLCGPTSRFLEAPTGPAPFDLVSLTRPQLRHRVRAALAEARARRQEVASPSVSTATEAGPLAQSVVVRPLPELAPAELFLVVFREAADPRPPPPGAAEPMIDQLERELLATREQWRATRHELEASNDELRSSNEEYQSLNEELHTSREELQSINEELQSVNAELRQKIEALDETHGDLQNLFDATDVGAILLDGAGRIRRFTPAATELYPMLPTDVGRPLTHISPLAPDLPLAEHIRAVGQTHQPVSAVAVRASDGSRFAVRVVPYRRPGGGVDGVVIAFVDVTQVHRAERAARDRQDDLVQVLDAVPAMVLYTHDPSAIVVSGNRVAATNLHLDADPFALVGPHRPYRLTRGGVALTHDDMAITRASRGESLQNIEKTIEYADGSVRHLLGNAEPLLDPDGRVRGAVAAFVDITTRVQAQAALAASEARYRTLANTAVDYISRFDQELRFLYANPSVLARLGVTLDALVGTTTGQPAGWQDKLRRVLDSGEPARFDWQADDGSWFDVQLSPELDQGRVTSVVSVARDVTAQKRAEQALSLSEQRYAAVFAVAAFGLLVADRATGVLLAVNPALEQILEIPAAQLLGRTVVDAGIVPPEERERVLVELTTRRSFRGFATRMSSPVSGHLRSVRVNLDVVTIEHDELVVVSVEDVTERLRAEEERARLEQGLLHAQKMEAIGTLAGGVAHDFNNILAGLQGGLSLLEAEVPAGPVRDELVELQALIQRGAGLTRQLLGFARGGKYDVRPLALGEAVERTASMFAQTRRDIVLELSVPPDLVVTMDRSQLEQVLLNLFVNAGHAMPNGGRLRVAAKGGPEVTLTVQDTGVGMSEETKARIFEPFFTTKAPGEGTGLGLASVYGIVTNHGGSVTVESEVGVGTTFTLQLPAAEGPAPARDVTPPAPVPRGRGTVLVVDDEPQVARVFARVLELAGYSVLTAERGRDAVEHVRKHGASVSAVLLDLTMPEMSGGATFDALRALQPDLRVVLCSGYGSDGPARELMARGCAAFLQKPFTARELTATLAKVLDS